MNTAWSTRPACQRCGGYRGQDLPGRVKQLGPNQPRPGPLMHIAFVGALTDVGHLHRDVANRVAVPPLARRSQHPTLIEVPHDRHDRIVTGDPLEVTAILLFPCGSAPQAVVATVTSDTSLIRAIAITSQDGRARLVGANTRTPGAASSPGASQIGH
jgi:hypothetical protein